MSNFKDKRAFYKTNLEENKRDQFTVEVNSEERLMLETLKALWDMKSDSKTLKLTLEIAINSTKSYLSPESWKFVLNTQRQRLSNYKKLEIPPPEENARV